MEGLKFLFIGWIIFAYLSYESLAEIQNRYYETVEQIVGVAASKQRARSSIYCSTR